MIRTITFLLSFLGISLSMNAQQFIPHSIHREQSEYFQGFNDQDIREPVTTGIQYFQPPPMNRGATNNQLTHLVFGYHPYWMTSTHLNYQWELLSDLCYFSYEVDASTGDPVTTHNWLTVDAVDSAQANGVRTHLCVTLFSDHASFFGSSDAKQNLIDQLIWYIQQRNADGINMDFEAVPYSLIDDYMDFLVDFCDQFHAAVPEGIVSIAVPAVDWSGLFDVELLSQYIDLFIIMGYDYYWNGSSQAGPVAPLYSMTANYDYNLSRSVSWYQSAGMPLEKFILGQPYYARQWPTVGGSTPSNTTGNGSALTYTNVKNNSSGHYTPENRHWESNSFSNYYAFQNGGWYQCFLEESYGLGKRYDLVRRRNLAGIGIWALGYDNGYTELWDLIAGKFTDAVTFQISDTLYDSGGPSWNYYPNEDYYLTIDNDGPMDIGCYFLDFTLEDGYDSLWFHEGSDTTGIILAAFSGTTLPENLTMPGTFTIRFKSDNALNMEGWRMVYHEIPNTIMERTDYGIECTVFPNPVKEYISFRVRSDKARKLTIRVVGSRGEIVYREKLSMEEGTGVYKLRSDFLTNELYFLQLLESNRIVCSRKFLLVD